jgi:PhoH-like ATPase
MEEIEAKYYDRIDERGKIAREILEYLGSFHIDELKRGVVQENGSILKLTTNFKEQKVDIAIGESECSKLDKRILQTCLGIKALVPENEKVVLVSKKSTLRKRAEMLGIKAQTFRDELLPEISEQYTGRKKLFVNDDIIKKFRDERKILLSDILTQEQRKDIYPNMFIELLGQYSKEQGRVYKDSIIPLSYETYYPYGVVPKNVGQKFMIEALMMDQERAPLVIIKGPAGTAKTFLSLAVGLELVGQEQYPNKILISRSPTETGEKIGFLPGDEKDKIMPYLRSAMDNLAALNASREDSARAKKKLSKKGKNFDSYQEDEKPQYENGTAFFERGDIKAEAIGYIRGRSITDTFIIIDEAQNLTPVEMKTIITRISEGSKMVILGDPAQIDRPELDERNNGLSYASEHMKGVETCWQITMNDEESVRSDIARIASMLL